jgi:ABC-2 type transport system permease protein
VTDRGGVNALSLTARQVVYTNKSFWRNPASAFFTFAFPLMFLVIFTSLLGNSETQIPGTGVRVSTSTYYVAAMATFAVISACYTNIAITVSFQRDAGILKRTRGTPLPGWAYLSGRVFHAVLIALLLVLITMAFGAAFYGADVPTGAGLLRFLVTLLVGSASFAALGLALTVAIPNADAAPAVVNASILPLLFISGIFIPLGNDPPAWMTVIGNVFPVRHFADAMRSGFLTSLFETAHAANPRVPASSFDWSDVLIVGIWGLAGLLIAARFFSWEPRR